MLRTVLLQLRAQPGRLLASGLAIVLGTAFVAVAVVLGASLQATSAGAIAGEYAATDVVVSGEVTPAQLARVAALPGVDVAEPRVLAAVTVDGRFVSARSTPQDPRLQWYGLADGRLPSAPGEVALADGTAEALGLRVGDRAELDPEGSGLPDAPTDPVQVVGLLDLDGSPTLAGAPLLLADPADAASWSGGAPPVGVDVLSDGSASDEALAAAVRDALPPETVDVATGQQRADAEVASLTDGVDVIGSLLLGFAAVALFVAALVIANTFAILVAQRTRSLALLRCLGATAGQVRRSVLAESAVLGVVASAVGAAAGTALVALSSLVLRRVDLPVDPVLDVPLRALWLPVLAGTVVTVVAASFPAGRATRIAPLAALRPVAAPVVRSSAGTVRILLGLLLLTAGGGLLALGVLVPSVPVGVLGGVVSFTGVLLVATLVVPRVVGLLGRGAARAGGVPAQLAAANAVRNPTRTTSTATALLVGSTLVAMMSVGAATTRASVSEVLTSSLPVDVDVMLDGAATPAGLADDLGRLDDVVATTSVRSAVLPVQDGDQVVVLRGVDVPVASQVLRDPDLLGQVEDDVAVMNPVTAEGLGLAAGDRLPVGDGGPRVVLQDLEGGAAFVTAATLARLAPDAPVTQVWLRLADGVDADDAVLAVEEAVAAVPGATVAGDARERAAFDRVLDTLLLVVTGLLAVAVVIAVVGIANVLSLSELERRRESALLRALGLTRGQLRATMAVEAVLVAAVGALLGVVLGVVYGWAGAATVLGEAVSTVTPAIPAGSLSAVIAAAVAAGLLASYLPGRRAARTSPVVVAGE